MLILCRMMLDEVQILFSRHSTDIIHENFLVSIQEIRLGFQAPDYGDASRHAKLCHIASILFWSQLINISHKIIRAWQTADNIESR